MTAPRDRDAIVRAWIDAGPRDLPDASRYAIATAVRTLPQRSRRSLLPSALVGLAGAAALVVVAVLATLPPAPNLPPRVGTAVLGTVEGPITMSYRIPGGLDVSIDDTHATGRLSGTPRAIIGFTVGGTGLYGTGPIDSDPIDETRYQPGSRGIVVADATDLKTHGLRGRDLGVTPEDFLSGIARYPGWDVRNVSDTTIAGRPALEASVRVAADEWSHLDTSDAEGTFIELFHPSRLIVTQVGEVRVLVQVWAGTDAELEAWLPYAMEFVDAIEFTPEP